MSEPPPCLQPRTARAKAARGALLLRRACFQIVLEAAIQVGVDRQVAGQQLGVDLLDLGRALVLLPRVDGAEADQQHRDRDEHTQRQAGPAAEVADHVARPYAGRGQDADRLGALARERELAGGLQPRGLAGVETQPLIQNMANLVAELEFIHSLFGTLCRAHSVMPRALSAAAKACAAREQCVFTLPSEQPMTRAVSATSSSSQ